MGVLFLSQIQICLLFDIFKYISFHVSGNTRMYFDINLSMFLKNLLPGALAARCKVVILLDLGDFDDIWNE